MRRKYRTECWLEGCLARERVCGLSEHITFAPLGIETPVMGAEGITMSPSGLDLAEDMWVKRLARALGSCLSTVYFSFASNLPATFL